MINLLHYLVQSFSIMRICCFSLSHGIWNWISMGFGLLKIEKFHRNHFIDHVMNLKYNEQIKK